ncbi:MAG: hypothetical protein MHM6MM_004049 [Cercozoa sp. M6MM]
MRVVCGLKRERKRETHTYIVALTLRVGHVHEYAWLHIACAGLLRAQPPPALTFFGNHDRTVLCHDHLRVTSTCGVVSLVERCDRFN